MSNTYCCVPECKSWAKKNPGITFHEFPELGKRKVFMVNKLGKEEIVDQHIAWVLKLRIGKKISSKYMYVCSRHFEDSDYFPRRNIQQKKILKRNSVPSRNLPFSSVVAVSTNTKINLDRSERKNRIIISMGYSCTYCKRKCVKGCGFKFFSFPKDDFLRSKWLKFCGLDIHPANDVSKLKLCSEHFTEANFRITRKDGPLLLNPDAIPSIVSKKLAHNFHGVTVLVQKGQDSQLERKLFDVTDSTVTAGPNEISHPTDTPIITDVGDQTPKKRKIWGPRHAREMSPSHFSTRRKARQNLNLINRDIKKKNLRITQLLQETYRLRKKIKTFEHYFEHLQQKGLVVNADILQLPNDTDNSQRYKTDGGALKIRKETVPKKGCVVHIALPKSELRRRGKNNLNSKRKFEDDAKQSTSAKSAKQTVSSEIEQIYIPEYQPYPGSSRFSNVGTMTNIETSTKSTMCVPEDFDTDEFSNPHPTSFFGSLTENTDFILVSSIKIEPEEIGDITVQNKTN